MSKQRGMPHIVKLHRKHAAFWSEMQGRFRGPHGAGPVAHAYLEQYLTLGQYSHESTHD